MKKFAMMMMACCMPMMMMAQSVQYCMTYGDYKAGHWTAVDDLVGGRTEQMPQIKWDDTEYKIKTGDKEAQGYPYDGNKLIVAVYHINDGAFLLGLGADVASFFTPLGTSIALDGVSAAIWLGRNQLNSFRCYVIDTDANEKGRYPVTRIDDEYMEKLLANDAHLLARYKAVSKKRDRQSASNVLAILTEKGLVPAE